MIYGKMHVATFNRAVWTADSTSTSTSLLCSASDHCPCLQILLLSGETSILSHSILLHISMNWTSVQHDVVHVATHLAPAGSDLPLSTLRDQGIGPSEFFPTVNGMNG